MEPVNVIIGLLILLLCILVFVIAFLVKTKSRRSILIIICTATIIVVALIGLFLHENKNIYMEDFSTFSIDNLSYSNEMIDASLETQIDDIGYAVTSTDELENRIQIGSFDLHFRNGSFSNLQFAVILSESGGPFEKNFQINYMGQIFPLSKTLAQNEISSDNTISLRELKSVITIISKSDMIQTMAVSAPNSMNVMFNGQLKTLPEEKSFAKIYIIQDENIIPLSHAETQSHKGYYVFSIVSETESIQILYPQYV